MFSQIWRMTIWTNLEGLDIEPTIYLLTLTLYLLLASPTRSEALCD